MISYSFEGQDSVAQSLLREVEIGRYLDIGCASPIEISNTFYFYERGWSGVCVDGRANLASEFRLHRPRDLFVSCLVDEINGARVYWEFPDPTMNTCDEETAMRYRERFEPSDCVSHSLQCRTARSIWSDAYGSAAAAPDLVTIDVEGNELRVLSGLISEEFRPKLIIVECKFFNFAHVQSHRIYEAFVANRYVMIAKTPLDAFFIDPFSESFKWLPRDMIAF